MPDDINAKVARHGQDLKLMNGRVDNELRQRVAGKADARLNASR